MKRISLLLALLAFFFAALAARAQLAPHNEEGVALGHLHFHVPDIEACKKFFIEELGATRAKLVEQEVLKLPGVILSFRKVDGYPPMEGSTIDHVAFFAKDGKSIIQRLRHSTYAKLGQSGQSKDPDPNNWRGAYIHLPGGVKLQIIENAEIKEPIRFDHIHLFVPGQAADGRPAWAELQEWYAKVFGMKVVSNTLVQPSAGNVFSSAWAINDISPGVQMMYSLAPKPVVGSKGRAMDHIGFTVKNLKQFCERLEKMGVKLDTPFAISRNTGWGYAFLTDPYGTYIELNENFETL